MRRVVTRDVTYRIGINRVLYSARIQLLTLEKCVGVPNSLDTSDKLFRTRESRYRKKESSR